MDQATFCKHLRRSGLLAEEQLTEAVARLSPDKDGRALARALIAQGLLTGFQAQRLLAGKARRLRLGQYVLLDLLGRGGMGQIFKAVHTTMDRVVAIKLIRPSVLQDHRSVELFEREVRAAARLQHANIVAAYDADKVKGTHFLVLEYVEGRNLHDLVREQGPLPVGLACELMRQAAEALQYAHEQGVVHRDIKPANLILARPSDLVDGRDRPAPVVKILDFGLARLRGRGHTTAVDTIPIEVGAIHGSIDYISPEQGQDVHAVDIRSDLYSLGCTFYYALAGQPPFPSGTFLEKLVKHVMSEPQPLQEVCPDVPPEVAAIIQRLLAKNQNDRFQIPAELAQELAGCCNKASRPASEPATEAIVAAPVPAGEEEAAAPEADAQPVPAPETVKMSPLHPGDAAFLENWRRWTTIVQLCVRRPGRAQRMQEQAYRTLHRELLQACRLRAEISEGAGRKLFRALEGLIEPWLTPEALLRTDQEILCDVLRHCQRAEQEFAKWLPGSQGSAEDTQPLAARLRSRYQERARRLDFEQDMRRLFGLNL